MLSARWHERGAATVEFYLVALLALLPLALGMMQTSILLIDNHHIDHAAFMAARSGASNHGDAGIMRTEFSRVITPLFVASAGGFDADNATGQIALARARAAADVAAFARIQILAPGPASQSDFGESREGAIVIPNDSLDHRSIAVGRNSGASLQQANMLRVQFTYCRPLVVPFIRGLMIGLLRQLDPEPVNLRCYAAGRIPIRSTGNAPMQSDFRVTGNAG